MVRLELIDVLLLAAVALLTWVAQGKLNAEKRIKRLKKENSALRDLTESQDEAIRKLSNINKHLICGQGNEPIVIIQDGHGYVKRVGVCDDKRV